MTREVCPGSGLPAFPWDDPDDALCDICGQRLVVDCLFQLPIHGTLTFAERASCPVAPPTGEDRYDAERAAAKGGDR